MRRLSFVACCYHEQREPALLAPRLWPPIPYICANAPPYVPKLFDRSEGSPTRRRRCTGHRCARIRIRALTPGFASGKVDLLGAKEAPDYWTSTSPTPPTAPS